VFTTEGGKHYSEGWFNLPCFLSSQETGFEMAMLKHFDVELLIGQLSYKLKASIYNLSHGYDTTEKKCSTLENEKKQLTNHHHMGMCIYLHLKCQFIYHVQSRYIKCLFAF